MSRAAWVILGTLGMAALFTSYAKQEPPAPPAAPRDTDFDTLDEKVLQTNAMLQMSREYAALEQTATAKAYAEQAPNPAPGAAARALQHVADGLEKLGKLRNVDKLRRLAAKIYVDPIPGVVAR
jgi:hypothetical protein